MDGRIGTWRAAFVSIRILSVYLVVHALITAALYSPFLASTGGSGRWAVIVAIVVLALSGVWLWMASYAIAERISDNEAELASDFEAEAGPSTRNPQSLDVISVMWIALTVVGIVVSVDGVSAVIVDIGQLIQSPSGFPQSSAYYSLVATLLRFAIGIGLVFGAPIIANSLRKRISRSNDPKESKP